MKYNYTKFIIVCSGKEVVAIHDTMDGSCPQPEELQAIINHCVHLLHNPSLINRPVSNQHLEDITASKVIAKRPATGFVYAMSCRTHRFIKIGFSKNPTVREQTLQGENPDHLMELSLPGTKSDETKIHRLLAAHRVRGEWFELPLDHIKSVITEVVNKNVKVMALENPF